MNIFKWKNKYDKLGQELQNMIDEAQMSRAMDEFEESIEDDLDLEKTNEKCSKIAWENFLTCSDFYNKYKFISEGAVYALLKKHIEYFDGNTVFRNGRLFFNELKLIQFYLESELANRMNRERMLYYSEGIPELKEKIQKIQNKKGNLINE